MTDEDIAIQHSNVDTSTLFESATRVAINMNNRVLDSNIMLFIPSMAVVTSVTESSIKLWVEYGGIVPRRSHAYWENPPTSIVAVKSL